MSDMGGACSCGFFDEPYFYREKIVRARKKYECCECGEAIEPGDKYHYAAGRWEDDFEEYRTCILCHRILSDLYWCGYCFGDLRLRLKEDFGIDLVEGKNERRS